MRDTMPLHAGLSGALDATSLARAQARDLVAGWMDGTASTQPPADFLRIEQLGSTDDASQDFSIGTFCWPIDGAGVRR